MLFITVLDQYEGIHFSLFSRNVLIYLKYIKPLLFTFFGNILLILYCFFTSMIIVTEMNEALFTVYISFLSIIMYLFQSVIITEIILWWGYEETLKDPRWASRGTTAWAPSSATPHKLASHPASPYQSGRLRWKCRLCAIKGRSIMKDTKK